MKKLRLVRFHLASWTGTECSVAKAARLAEELDDRSDIELMDDDDEKNEAEEFVPQRWQQGK